MNVFSLLNSVHGRYCFMCMYLTPPFPPDCCSLSGACVVLARNRRETPELSISRLFNQFTTQELYICPLPGVHEKPLPYTYEKSRLGVTNVLFWPEIIEKLQSFQLHVCLINLQLKNCMYSAPCQMITR